MKNGQLKERKELFFKLNIKNDNVFFIYIYKYNNNKNLVFLKKNWKNVYALSIKKSFSNHQTTYQNELYLLFEK